jgi:anhydro-N-acetylmuramic acid kinase
MIYRVLGLMSGSSLDGLDLAYVHLHSGAGKWGYTLVEAETLPYSVEWRGLLEGASALNARDYLVLHHNFGCYLGERVNQFIQTRNLDFQVQLVASHGHTVFHLPSMGMTAQLGDGAPIAAITGLPVVTDLRTLDMALGGQGAPIVPIGEKWLFPTYAYFLNLGGIANVSTGDRIAFDVCPANRVLNLLASRKGASFDPGGAWASAGRLLPDLLAALNGLDYYRLPPPKSLDNAFGTEIVYGIIRDSGCSPEDGLRTYTEHIALQVAAALQGGAPGEMLVTGGGAHNRYLVARIAAHVEPLGIQVMVPDPDLVNFKEALVVALFGVLRWRQEVNVLASVTGASRDSIGGALWTGQDA